MQWSYEVIDQTGPLPGRLLNELGKQGWELVSVVIPRNAHFIYYFKRRLEVERSDITCPYCGLTSNHPMDIEKEWCGNCGKTHSELPRGLPLWVQKCTKERRLWTEDDVFPADKLNLDPKWKELFKESRPEIPLVIFDDQDNLYYLYPHWRVARVSGTGETAIYQLQSSDLCQEERRQG